MPLHADIVAVLNERASQAAADRLVGQMTRAGKVSGEAFGKALQDEANRTNIAVDRIRADLENSFRDQGARAGRGFGTSFSGELASALPIVGGFSSAMAGYETAAGKAGAVAGRALGMAFTTAAAGIVGAVGLTLFKGFERYEAIDAATNRLNNLNRTLESTGRAGIDVGRVMETVTEVVQGTPFAMDQAFSVATRALSSNTGDLQRFMTVTADAAGFAGGSISEIGDAFLKIANTGKVSMEEVGNELRNIPVLPWLQQQMGVTGSELSKMITEGKVGLEDLMSAIETNTGGFAKAAGETVSGAVDNVNTAVARLGANFLGAIFGAPTEDANDLVSSLNSIQDRIDEMGAWVTEHREEIAAAFRDAADAAQDVWNAVSAVADMLDSLGISAGDVVLAFAGWKSIQGVSALIDSLGGVRTLLSMGLPEAADQGAKGISRALGAVAIPAWLTYVMNNNVSPQLSNATGDDLSPSDASWWERLGDKAEAWVPGSQFQPAGPGGLPIGPSGPPQSAAGTPGVLGDLFGLHPGVSFPGGIGGPADAQRDRRGISPIVGAGGAGPAGAPILDAPGLGDDSSGPRLPPAPGVPYADVPAIDPRLQMTAGLYSAQTSVADAKTRLAEKEARLAQLEATNEATAEERLNARADRDKAEREATEAGLRFDEAQKTAFEQQYKQLNKQINDLGEIGARLDDDFGISDGLAGIAENFTKLLANIAAAPLLGQLGAVSAMSPSQGGYGAVGIAAARGAFGQKYDGIDYGQQVAMMGPAGLRSGGVVGGGQPYSMPAGTNSGGYGGDGARFPDWVYRLGDAFGLEPSTYPGHQEDRGQGNQGIDWVGPVENMQKFSEYLLSIRDAPGLEDVIWQNPNTGEKIGVNQGRQVGVPGSADPGYFRNDFGDHQNHVHTTQQASIPAPVGGGTSATAGTGGWGANWDAMAQAESSGNWQANTGNGYYGGLQFLPSSWSAAGGDQYAPRADLATPEQQMLTAEQLLALQGPTAWPNTFVPAGGGGTGGYNGIPFPQSPVLGNLPPMPGSVGTGAVPGTSGVGFAPPGVGGAAMAGANATRIGGGDGLSGTGKGGVGASDGLMAMAGMAASGLDILAPGAGQAAQTGMKLANRAIQFGGQAVGIGVQGALDTFLPFGGSELASRNWLTRIVGGVAGAAPALPNMAGKATQQTAESVVGQDPNAAGQQQPTQQGDTSITVNNNRPTEDGTGRDIAWHQQQQNQAPGMG